jgi:hypothetical protein
MTRESKTSPRSPVAFENVFNAELRARNRERRAGFRRLAAAEAAGGPCRNDPLPPLELVEIRLDDLKLPARRLRKRDPAHVREIANAIARLGYSRPILVGRDNEVIDGESVVGAVRLLGFDRLTCVRVDHLSASEQRVLRLAINRLAEKGCQTASKIGSDAHLMKLRRRFGLVSQGNQRRAISSRLRVAPTRLFRG